MGIEPMSSAWKAEVLPLNYTRRSQTPARSSEVPSETRAPPTSLLALAGRAGHAPLMLLLSQGTSRGTTAGPADVGRAQELARHPLADHLTRHQDLVEGVGFEPTKA